MNKVEYVKTIERALVGHVSSQELADSVQYYRDYIDMEIAKGRSEKEVLDGLGNPRLLAKSIIVAKGNAGAENGSKEAPESARETGSYRVPWVVVILVAVIFVLLFLGLLISVLRLVFPFLIPIIIIVLVISVSRKWRR